MRLVSLNGMHASQKNSTSAKLQGLYHQAALQIGDYGLSDFHILENNYLSDHGSDRTSHSFEKCKEYYTLDSSTLTPCFASCESPAISIASSTSPFPPLISFSEASYSPDTNSYSTAADESSILKQKLRELEISLVGPESESSISHDFCFSDGMQQHQQDTAWDWDHLSQIVPQLTIKKVLIACAQAVSNLDMPRIAGFMHLLEQKVSVSGDPLERLGAYMLEGLKAKLEFSGSTIYKALKCDVPVSSDLMTYMGFLYQICPYWKFAYVSSNAAILEAVQREPRIHVIDFQIAQGSQWLSLMQSLAARHGGPPAVRITGVDDPHSAHARGGGLEIVARRLSEAAQRLGVPFEFHDAAISCGEVQTETLRLFHGEAVVVNFPFVLHHIPDESVSTWNHRDRLLRHVKSLSPKIVTLIEQESNTNTRPFYLRFVETLDYYTAMFESIDAARPRNDLQRINAEQHCVARDIVNMIACEDGDRVERHELLGKWRLRLTMAGFVQQPLGPPAAQSVRDMLREYDRSFRLEETDGALYLWWKSRAMATSSAWR